MPCTITFVTGRSRTADNELERIVGVPGPTAMHFVVAADAYACPALPAESFAPRAGSNDS